jgi:diguanylate cyclase (GGDEF)-like protein
VINTPTQSEVERLSHFPYEKLIARYALAMFLTLCALVGYLVWDGIGFVNRQIAQNEKKFISLHLNNQSELVADFLWTALAWDEAVVNLQQKFNPDWAAINIGNYLFDIQKFSYSFVYSPSDAVLFAAQEGEPRSAADLRNIALLAQPLVQSLRIKEAALPNIDGMANAPKTLLPAVYDQDYVRVNGVPYLATALIISGDQTSQRLASRPHVIVVTFKKINDVYFNDLEQLAEVDGLVIGGGCQTATPDRTCIELKGLSAKVAFSLSWDVGGSRQPLSGQSIAPLSLGLALFIILSASFLWWGWSLNQKYIRGREKITFMAFHDPLTGLPNRGLAFDRLRQTIAALKRDPKWIAVHALDLDMFKNVNDTYGHAVGDRLLCVMAERLRMLCRETDTISRLGGDEFLVFQTIEFPAQAATLAERIIRELSKSVELPNGTVRISCSIGTVTTNDPDATVENLVLQADAALYITKSEGGGSVTFFDENIDQVMRRDRLMKDRLALAIARGDINVFYQKIIDQTGTCVSVEALARWENPIGLDIAPSEFLRIADESHQSVDLGRLILQKIADDSQHFSGLRICINVSLNQLRSSLFEECLIDCIERRFSKKCTYELEISEAVWLPDAQDLAAIVNRLRLAGYTFALDDFGTGNLRLNQIKQFNFDRVKIDQDLIIEITTNARVRSAVEAVMHLSGSLDAQVVAEGVENQAAADLLREIGVPLLQGYLIGRPMPIDRIAVASPPLG